MCTQQGETPTRSLLARMVDAHPRAATFASLTCWIAAILTVALHANKIGMRGDMAFLFADSWLIGLGCVGVPVLVLTLLGHHLTPRVLELIAAACFASAIVVTVFVTTGQSHMDLWTACFLLILFLALGIQALNGAYGLDRRARIAERVRGEERARRADDVQAAFIAGIARAHDAQRRRADEVTRILDMPTAEIEAISGQLVKELERRYDRPNRSATILHLITQRDGEELPPTGSESD